MIILWDFPAGTTLSMYYREPGVHDLRKGSDGDIHIGYLYRHPRVGGFHYVAELMIPYPRQYDLEDMDQAEMLKFIEDTWLKYWRPSVSAKKWYTELSFRVIAVELDHCSDDSGTLTIRETTQGEDFIFKVDDCSEVSVGSVFHLEPGD